MRHLAVLTMRDVCVCTHMHTSLDAPFLFALRFIWLICCVEAMRCREAPFCTVQHQKPAAVCHCCGLKPPSAYLHTDTHTHTYTCCTHTSMQTQMYKQKIPPCAAREHNSFKGDRPRDQRIEQSFSPHLHDRERSLHPIIQRGRQPVSSSSADQRE